MSYYIIPNVEEEAEFAQIMGPYRNKDQVIDTLESIANAGVFTTKAEAREYIENFIGKRFE